MGWDNIAASRKVLQSVPTPVESSGALSHAWYLRDMYARDYPAALNVIDKAPAAWFTQKLYPRELYQARVYQAQGNVAKARAAFMSASKQLDMWVNKAPDRAMGPAHLALALARLGQKAHAVSEARHALVLAPKGALMKPYFLLVIAEVNAQVDNTQGAVKQLDQLLAGPAGGATSVHLLMLDPVWDPIRHDARFQALLKKYAKYKPTALPATPHSPL